MSSDENKDNITSTERDLDIEHKPAPSGPQSDDGDVDLLEEYHKHTAAEYKRLARKIDWVLMPMMFLVYGFQGQDKSSISAQAIFGLRDDLHMKGQQYQLLNTIFSIAILLGTVPSLILLQKLRLGFILNLYMTAWGVLVICSSAVQTWPQLMALRALQGWFESICHPAFIVITSQYYQQNDHGPRSLVWQSAGFTFSLVVSFIEYGLGKYAQDHPGSMHAWRSICLFLGSGTLATTIASWFLIGSPDTVRWLNEKERRMVAARTISNKSGRTFQTSDVNWDQVREAMKDTQVWIIFFHTMLISTNNSALAGYSRILYTSFGFSSLQTMLVDTPRPAVAGLLFVFFFFYLKRFPRHRLIVMSSILSANVAGNVILAVTEHTPENKWLLWAGLVITVPGYVTIALGMSLVASNFAGKTKKAVVLAICFLGVNIGNIIGSQVFQTSDGPRYIPAYIGLISLAVTEMILLAGWRIYLARQNKIRDNAAQAMGIDPEERERIGQQLGERDVTDKENPHFRYAL